MSQTTVKIYTNTAVNEAKATLNQWGYDRIREGFLNRDPDVERALVSIGRTINFQRDTDRMPRHLLIMDAWELIQERA